MGFIKRQSIHERLVGDNSIILTSDGDVEINPTGGNVRITGDVAVTGNISGPQVTNVLYVTTDGNDENDGRSAGPDGAKRTIKGAVAVATANTTIMVAPGDYYENNPITMPDFVTISGTGELRNTRVWPNNNTQDFFFMGNGCYLFQLTFRGLRAPAWCAKIRPGTLCTTSPYVQNCTNMNGPWLNDGTEFIPFETRQLDGIEPGARPLLVEDYPQLPTSKQVNDYGGGGGLLVDGDEYNPASLVKSFVADAFTQISQGGPGFEVTNFGYTQIVSCFSVFCSVGFKTTKGGYLSISNSVSDFGIEGVVADGFYPTSYTSAVPVQDYFSSVASTTILSPGSGYTSAPLVTIDAPTGAGGVQATASAVIDTTTGQVAGITILENGSGYEVVPQITMSGGGATIQATARINLQTNSVIRIGSLRDKPQVGSIIQFQGDPTYYYITLANQIIPPFFYDEEVCRRDLRFIVDAVMGDIVMGTNYQSLAAGRAYLRSTSAKVLNDQLEATIFGINAARDEMISISANAAVDTLITDKFAIITNFLDRQDSVAAPDIVYNDLTSVDVGVRRAKDNIVANRDFVIDEILNYIREQFTELSYHRPNFDTDVERLARGVALYTALGSEYLIVQHAREYEYRENLKSLLVDGFRSVQDTMSSITEVQADSTALERVNEGFNIWVNVLDEGDSQDIRFDYPDHLGVDANRRDAKDQLQANREFLGAEFIAYLEEEHPLFGQDWDSDEEERWLKGFEDIIDALSYDIMYACNVATVYQGFKFFEDFNISDLSAVSTASLADTFARLRAVIQKVVREQIVTATQGNTKIQNFDNPAATSIEAERLDALLFNIEDMVDEQTTSRLPTKTFPNTDAEAQALQDAYLEIIDATSSAQNVANALIRNDYPNQSYNEDKCKRDVEYIVKAVYRDAQLGTNHNSLTAAKAYDRANVAYLNSEQKPATILALREAKRLSVNAITLDSFIAEQVTNRWDDVLNYLEYEQEPSEGKVFESPGPAGQSLIDAVDTLIDNRTFLTNETTAFINNVYDNGSGTLFVYDSDKCSRDTGLIIDAIGYDVAFGTNYNAVTTGLSYQRAGSGYVQSDQQTETIGAINYVKSQSATYLAADATAVSRSNAAVVEIIDIIQNGVVSTDTAADALTFPIPSGAAATITAARDRLQANKDFLAADVRAYIVNNYPSLIFDQTKCERDTKYIIDGLTYDIVYGGNTATRLTAQSYWEGTNTQVSGQQVETASGFNHLQGLIEEILLGNSITAQVGNSETQDTTGSNSSATEIADLEALVQIVEDVVEFGTDTLPNPDYPSVSWVASGIQTARQNLLDNKAILQSDTIDYINTTYNGFSYDEAKCQSDTGKILDALTHDLLYTGNIAMLLATTSYYLGAVEYLPDSQAATTAAAWEHLKGVIQDVIQGVVVTPSTGNSESQVLSGAYGGVVESANVETLMDILIDTIERQAAGASTPLLGTPSEIEPDFSWLSLNQQNASNQLLNAMTTIQTGTIDYIYTNLVEFTYNTAKCARDTGYIIDAAVYDMMYGGNKQTRRAGLAYYGSTILNNTSNFGTADQTDVTAFTYYHLGNVLKEVAQNNPVTTSNGVILTQDVSIPDGSLAAGETIELLIDRIGEAIDEGYTTGWTELNHDYSLGNATYNVERVEILNQRSDIVDNAIFALNAEYGGTYDITVSPGLITVQQDTLSALYNVSTISTSGHAFEYVGAGISYNALPFFGGSPIAENEIIQRNQGKVFAGGTVDQIGNFRVGDFFSVNALTGAITLNANQIDLSGLTSIGPLIRDNIPVGVELQEISNNPNMTASNGTADGNTAPTQYAVVNYVENRYLNKLTGGTITGDVILDGDFDIQGDVLSTDITGAFNLLNTSATTIEAFGDATTINMGAATGLMTINPDLTVEGTLTVNGNIVFEGDVAITIPDESLQAYSITEGTEDYVSINTREGEEKVTFGEQPKVEIRNDSESTSTTTGALVVDGGVGIKTNTFIGGVLEVDGNVRLGSDRVEDSLDINAITDIDIPDNTDAAVRIHENISDYFTIDTTDGSEVVEIGATPVVTILNLSNATDANTGALQVTGGISSQRNIHAGVDITADQDIIADRDMQVNGTNITTDETGTFNVFNTNATTINAFGDATDVNVGAATGTLTVNNDITIFDSAEAIQVPVGTDAQRPSAVTGQIRFNTDSNAYEGYDGSQWGVLGGLKDVDQNTFIRPETTPGANNDALEFFTGGGLRATLDATKFEIENGSAVWIKDTTESDSHDSGALRVAGGVGIEKNLHVAGWIGGNNDGVLQLTRYATDTLDIRANEVLAQDGLRIITNAPDSAADDIIYPMTFAHHTISGTPVIGSGTGVKFELETTGSNFETGAQIDVIAQDVTTAQEDFDVVISSMTSGSVTEKFRLSELTATLTTSLQVDNNLNVTGIADAAGFRGSLFGDDSTEIVDAINSRLTITNADVGTLTLTTDLEVQYGGTGVSTFTTDGILYGNAADPVQVTDAAGTSDASESFQVLTVTSASDTTPVWTDTIDGGSF